MPFIKKSSGAKFYSNKYGYSLSQQNGQRTYGGPPPNWGSRPPPSRDCEVFIGRLPRLCFEDELLPLFLSIGELYEFRLMLDFSGTNRGYAYAHYTTKEDAQKAIERLNKYEIRPGHFIGVLKSKNNCRLLFGNIESTVDVKQFNEFLCSATEGVSNVIMFKNFAELRQTSFRISAEVEEAFLNRMPKNNGSHQFAIAEYETHKAAAVARRILIPKYGHALAIDWAVPPREKKSNYGNNTPLNLPYTTERQYPGIITKNAPCSNSKIRPVPEFTARNFDLDNVTFMPKTFKAVVKFFKYQMSVCLYKSVVQLEIPLFICKEIEKKIVDHVTNVENCSQAVQLIFNYFSWFNEKKRVVMNSEVQTLLQEVKQYSDCYVHFINKILRSNGPSQSSDEENFYIHTLPLQINVLFRIILRSNPEYQIKAFTGITNGLNWLRESVQNGDKATKEFINKMITLVKNEDETALDKAVQLAKSFFLLTLSSQQSQNLVINTLARNNALLGNEQFLDVNNGSQNPNSSAALHALQTLLSNFESEQLKENYDYRIVRPFFKVGELNEETTANANSYLSVPLLLIQPSILNHVPFMPSMFDNILNYFKHLLRSYLTITAWQMNLPDQISNEIERKIIDRISNMENCSVGVQLILNYFLECSKKYLPLKQIDIDPQKLLQDVKLCADSFVSFVWRKTKRVYIPDETTENYFCQILPLRLNILYYITLIYNKENPRKLLIGVSEGLMWLEKLFERYENTSMELLAELSKFLLQWDPTAYEKVLKRRKSFWAEEMNILGEAINSNNFPFFVTLDNVLNKSSLRLLTSAEITSIAYVTDSDCTLSDLD